MNAFAKDLLYAVNVGMLLPTALLAAAVGIRQQPEREMPVFESTAETSYSRQHMPVSVLGLDEEEMDVYLVGVVLAEMPAEFEPEALKAQAVAARTFSMKAAQTGGKHGDGSVCTEPSCCQAYLDPEEFLNRGGRAEDLAKVRRAVEDTAGMVLTYDGALIEATYYSCSGGRTEDAVAVWGTDYPYLRAVDSPGEESAVHFLDSVYFTPTDFCNQLGQRLSGNPAEWIGEVERTSGGGVQELRIGKKHYTGQELRVLLGLPSAAFTITAEENGIYIETRGYGHRVGMSQYGAQAMALDGSSYREILQHYYPGTVLQCWEEK